MNPKVSKVSVAKLVIDMTLYPRHEVDRYTVNRLVDALAAGETLPPITVDKASGIVIDGIHRVNAVVKHSGPEAEIDVLYQQYANRQEMFEDAVRLNARHGRKLTAWDTVRVAQLGQEYGMTVEAIASALAMIPEKVQGLMTRTAIDKSNMQTVALKYAMRDLSGTELNPQQVEGNKRAGGISPLGVVSQTMTFLRAGLYNIEDERTCQKLTELRNALTLALSEPLAKAA